MGGTDFFEQIALEIQQQQERMEALQKENQMLRKQLAELRAGKGIMLNLGGTIFELQATDAVTTPIVHAQVAGVSEMVDLGSAVTAPRLVAINTPLPIVAEVEQQPTAEVHVEAVLEEQEVVTPSFLEEIMLDEFSAAMSRPVTPWQGQRQPETEKVAAEKPATKELDEQQKAALRRELMGSFLLG
jgi:hypothetical protein